MPTSALPADAEGAGTGSRPGTSFVPTLAAIALVLTVPFGVTLLTDGRDPPSIAAGQPLSELGTSLKHLLLLAAVAQPVLYILGRRPSGRGRLRLALAAVLLAAPPVVVDLVLRGRVAASGVISLAVLVGLAAYAAPVHPVTLARVCALGPVLSILMWVVTPQLALFGEATAGISRLSRLAGVYSQPNLLASFAGLALICYLAARADVRTRVDRVAAALCALAVLLSQSYTTWIATAFALLVLVPPRRRALRAAAVAGVAAGMAFVLRGAAELSSVRERQQLWAAALDAWEQSPLVGMGPAFWGSQIEDGSLPRYAVHAHNQFLDVLATTGMLGLIATVWALLILARSYVALDAGATMRRMGLAVLAFELVRAVSEVPFNVYYAGGGLLVLGVLLAVAVSSVRPSPSVAFVRRPGPAGAPGRARAGLIRPPASGAEPTR